MLQKFLSVVSGSFLRPKVWITRQIPRLPLRPPTATDPGTTTAILHTGACGGETMIGEAGFGVGGKTALGNHGTHHRKH